MIKKVERLCIFEDGFQKAAKPVQIVATTRRAQIFLSAVAFRRRAVKYGRQEYDDARDGSALLPVGPIYAADLSQPVSFAQKLIKLQKVPTHVVQLSRAKLMQNMQMRSCHAKKKLASSKLR